MALSRRMAAPFFVIVLLVIIVAAETATARDVTEEKLCRSLSQSFSGRCVFESNNCDTMCKAEKFSGGDCDMDGFEPKCFCRKVC